MADPADLATARALWLRLVELTREGGGVDAGQAEAIAAAIDARVAAERAACLAAAVDVAGRLQGEYDAALIGGETRDALRLAGGRMQGAVAVADALRARDAGGT